jgi:MoaA/NifB/PqqE/SkfB family radical SAM enzyme
VVKAAALRCTFSALNTDGGMRAVLQFAVDFEITNRCNAHCSFCPRDATPHQGLMSVETFDQSLQRATELRAVTESLYPDVDMTISLCGLGEPLLHRETPNFARRVREAGFTCTMASNGALLDERRGQAMLDAGLQRIYLNVGEIDDEYEEVYRLPFEKTRANIVRFVQMAEGKCDVYVVLVNHRRDATHVSAMEQYWRDLGIRQFIKFEIMNRAGSLQVEHMQYEDMLPELARAQTMLDERDGEALCGNPFWQTFIGYDGIVYLCCADWEKRSPLGSVYDSETVFALSERLEISRTREPICKTCNHDPLNHLAGELRAADEGECSIAEVEAIADMLVAQGSKIIAEIPDYEDAARRMGYTSRKRIPVRAL